MAAGNQTKEVGEEIEKNILDGKWCLEFEAHLQT